MTKLNMTRKEMLIDFFISYLQQVKNETQQAMDKLIEAHSLLIETHKHLSDLQDEVERRLDD